MATGFHGAILDVDGVLVDSPHKRAWMDSLPELMETDWADIRDRTTRSDDRFTAQVYQQECPACRERPSATATATAGCSNQTTRIVSDPSRSGTSGSLNQWPFSAR